MPIRPPRLCSRCRTPHIGKDCPRCQPAIQAEKDERRGSSTERGYDAHWRHAAKAFLAQNPLCHYSRLMGRTAAAECVDHAIPPTGPDDPRFWDQANWRPSTIQHNSAKGRKTEAQYLASLGVS